MSTALNCVATQKKAKNIIIRAYTTRWSVVGLDRSCANLYSEPLKPCDVGSVNFMMMADGIWMSGWAKMIGMTPV